MVCYRGQNKASAAGLQDFREISVSDPLGDSEEYLIHSVVLIPKDLYKPS